MIYFFVYLLIGACWANIADEFIFKNNKASTIDNIGRAMFWPLDIITGGISR